MTEDSQIASVQTSNRPQAARPNYAKLHAKPLPLDIHALPAFLPQNPLSILRIAYAILSSYFTKPSSHPSPHTYRAFYSASTISVHVTEEQTVRALWESGFFGKGSLSRSEPEWLEREKRRLGLLGTSGNETSAEVTRKRREERREGKRQRARLEREELENQLRREGKLASDPVSIASNESEGVLNRHGAIPIIESRKGPQQYDKTRHVPDINQNEEGGVIQHASSEPSLRQILDSKEHLQLIAYEAFFLAYGLGILDIHDPATGQLFSNQDLLKLFRHTSLYPSIPGCAHPPPDDPFIITYVVYHHFRSLGWVVRPGVKFSVDLLLYNRGPVFSHAEFAVLILPDHRRGQQTRTSGLADPKTTSEKNEWWWLHAANRVQSQVRKTLVVAYVEIPSDQPLMDAAYPQDIGALLKRYKIREFIVRRWTANKNR